MERHKLKKSFFVFGLSLAFLVSCDEWSKKEVTGTLPKAPAKPAVSSTAGTPAKPGTPVKPKPPAHVFAGPFQVVNSGFYETLMKVCARCGTKRIINTPFGTRYERYYSWGESLKECANWLSEGFLQLEFAELKLPTSVKVLIQPKYRGSSDQWGEPFELTATASPINQNKGFEIFISPNQGLGGLQNLILSSTSANHVQFSDLSVTITYGPQAQVIAHPSLKKYTARWVEKPKYPCGQYTN